MRQIFSLNDAQWFIGAVAPQPFGAGNDFARVKGWLPATVPGDVRLDLLRLNKIPDPFLGKNNLASEWVDEYDWWYRREIPRAPNEHTRTFLVFEGIDYQSAVYWDDTLLGTHTGMFSRQVYEIPNALLQNETHRLAVRVWGGNQLPRAKLNWRERAWKTVAGRLLPHSPQAPEFPDRYQTLKCQMAYGWDFAPRLLTCGIWDEAFLIQTRELFLRDIWAQGVPDGRVRVTLHFDTTRARDVRVQFRVQPKNFHAPFQQFEISLHVETSGSQSFSLQLENPRVWNPWDRGAPNLYSLTVRVLDETGELDANETTFGLRTIELAANPGAPKDSAPWTFVINGQPEFIRGANWVPADAIPARVTRNDYAALLQLARDANINLLRVWGGGLREKRAFYELCDALGILVWQEFPLAGAGMDYFPRDAAYLELLKQEAIAITQTLRNHPSVVLWCGGNEFIPRLNRHVTNVLRKVVAKHDGTRPFKIASPSQDESHNWRVWHGYANTRDYETDRALFFGEFGLQAAPNVETLARFLPDHARFPPDADWAYHNADIDKLWRYALPLLPFRAKREISDANSVDVNSADANSTSGISLQEFVDASQEAQLRGLQIAIEYARRNKPRVSGCAFWQFNEPWYSICWSVVDYTRTPKRAYAKIKELYNPVLVSFAFPRRARRAGEIVSGQIWLINDTLHEISGTLSAWHNDALLISQDVTLPANRAREWTALDLALTQGANRLRLELRAENLLATNEYDLNYCDAGEINARRAMLANSAAWLRTTP
jgi:beta-mannosidase